jgi:hypothetical protein
VVAYKSSSYPFVQLVTSLLTIGLRTGLRFRFGTYGVRHTPLTPVTSFLFLIDVPLSAISPSHFDTPLPTNCFDEDLDRGVLSEKSSHVPTKTL